MKFIKYFLGPIAYLLEIAAVLAAVLENWIDFGILLFVLFGNAFIAFYQEAKADSALESLKNTLALKSRVIRNEFVEIDSKYLVPGDVIALRRGDIVPADCRLTGYDVSHQPTTNNLELDESALTGESLPVSKGKDAIVYSSSIVKLGSMLGVVVKTGRHTFVGRAANLISITSTEGQFQRVMRNIGNFLIGISLTLALIIFVDSLVVRHDSILFSLKRTVIITIASIPIGLPAVMSVTMAVGATELAKKKVIIKRLTAIEELAAVDILCSDKTGTLTKNKLSFDEPYLAFKGNTPDNPKGTGEQYTKHELLSFGYLASENDSHDPIEDAVCKAAKKELPDLKDSTDIAGFKIIDFTPFNSTSKFTKSTIETENGDRYSVIKGAPQVVIKKCGESPIFERVVDQFAARGLRALGVARSQSSNDQEPDSNRVSIFNPE